MELVTGALFLSQWVVWLLHCIRRISPPLNINYTKSFQVRSEDSICTRRVRLWYVTRRITCRMSRLEVWCLIWTCEVGTHRRTIRIKIKLDPASFWLSVPDFVEMCSIVADRTRRMVMSVCLCSYDSCGLTNGVVDPSITHWSDICVILFGTTLVERVLFYVL